MTNVRPISVDEIDQALADLALLMRAQGDYGLSALPIFERLERERDRLVDVDDRLDRALARLQSKVITGRFSLPPPL